MRLNGKDFTSADLKKVAGYVMQARAHVRLLMPAMALHDAVRWCYAIGKPHRGHAGTGSLSCQEHTAPFPIHRLPTHPGRMTF